MGFLLCTLGVAAQAQSDAPRPKSKPANKHKTTQPIHKVTAKSTANGLRA